MQFTIRVNGQSIGVFSTLEEAKNFITNFRYQQSGERFKIALIDNVVENSDCDEAKKVIKRIMELK
jgi:hypothetical protein